MKLWVLMIRHGERERALIAASAIRQAFPKAKVQAIVEASVANEPLFETLFHRCERVPSFKTDACSVLKWMLRCVEFETDSVQRVYRISPNVVVNGNCIPEFEADQAYFRSWEGSDVFPDYWSASPAWINRALQLHTASKINLDVPERAIAANIGPHLPVQKFNDNAFLASFDVLPNDYDHDRFRNATQAILFMAPRLGAKDERCREMREMWQFLFENKPLPRNNAISDAQKLGATRMHSGWRPDTASAPLKVDAIVSVVTGEVAADLERLLPTAGWHMPRIPLHIVCDEEAGQKARAIATKFGLDNVIVHCWITKETLAIAERKVAGTGKFSDYWKPGPIWFKLEALRRIVADHQGNKGILLVDSDIVFGSAVTERFHGVDLVLSPFYWPDPLLQARASPNDIYEVPIAQRDGWFNAGYVLTRSIEVCEAWQALYESGVGFYEQWCMGFLPQIARFDVFGTAHNWGQWRHEIPRMGTISYHIHAWTKHSAIVGAELQRHADSAADFARKQLALYMSVT